MNFKKPWKLLDAERVRLSPPSMAAGKERAPLSRSRTRILGFKTYPAKLAVVVVLRERISIRSVDHSRHQPDEERVM